MVVVLGVVDTHKGIKIANEMTEWLERGYSVVPFFHNGEQFEYPAIKYAQEYAIQNDCSVLYLHTKGACNENPVQEKIRRFWSIEFSNVEKYQRIDKEPTACVYTPFLGDNCECWFNGFVANTKAWRLLDIQPCADRYYYEHCWRGKPIKMKGTCLENVRSGTNGNLSNEQIKMFNFIDSVVF